MFAAFYMITSGFPLYVSTISNNPAIAGTLTTTLMTASLITRFFASVLIQKNKYESTSSCINHLFYGDYCSYLF